MSFSSIFVALLAGVALSLTEGFYLPGVAPRNFERGDAVDLKVNKLSSTQTQLPAITTVSFVSLPRSQTLQRKSGQFSEIALRTAYDITMLEEKFCKVLCKVNLKSKDTTTCSGD